MKHLGIRIQQLRVAKGLSKTDLASQVGVTPTAVWNWEKNGLIPRIGTMGKIAVCLGVELDDLQREAEKLELVAQADRPESVAEMIEETRVKISKATGFALERVKLHLEFTKD